MIEHHEVRQQVGAILTERSSSAEVRNPILALAAAKQLKSLSPEARSALANVLRELRDDARSRAQTSWRKNKGPMAVYWKAVGAYCNHLYRVVRP